MGVYSGPDLKEDGLVLCLDGANYKSFKGVPATNILNQISYNQSNQNTSLYKVTNGSENVYIPSLGYVNSKFMDFYNDYNGGSGVCCPALFFYGSVAVSPSTTYTYSIIYKTTTGYSHPNYMYRYEYNGSEGYVKEGGVHSTNNRTSLGDGWWFAWGQFTTSATTASLTTYLFHYEYATQNRVYVYKAALYAGTYIIPPEHMLNSSENRGTTFATGGGWADLSGKANHGELVNGVKESSDKLGALVFDGSDDYVETSSFIPNITNKTLSAWVKLGSTTQQGGGLIGIMGDGGEPFDTIVYNETDNGWGFGSTGFQRTAWSGVKETSTTTWVYLCATYTNNDYRLYRNGLQILQTTSYSALNFNFNSKIILGKRHGSGVIGPLNASIALGSIYNRALTASEIRQNFNANRARFGI